MTCTATDTAGKSASCTFPVTVTMPVVSLSVHTILAFGDSITEGEVPDPGEFPEFLLGTSAIRPYVVQPTEAYPADLANLLAARYPTQGASVIQSFTLYTSDNSTYCGTDTPRPTSPGIIVINAGCLGEAAQSPDALARLKDKLTFYQPDLVLILEGANDIGSVTSDQAGVAGVQSLILAAQGTGAKVMVSTLLPQVESELTHSAPVNEDITIFNGLLQSMVPGTGATLVDLYTDISSNLNAYISPYDGLHPTAAGYQEMAHYWFTHIQAAFEVSSSSAGARATSSQSPPARSTKTPASASTR